MQNLNQGYPRLRMAFHAVERMGDNLLFGTGSCRARGINHSHMFLVVLKQIFRLYDIYAEGCKCTYE